jgi:hypothetical protein
MASQGECNLSEIEVSLPVTDRSIVDFAWALSFYFSDNQQERQFGEDLKKKWDTLLTNSDSHVQDLMQNVNAAMSATVYNIAQLRHDKAEYFAFLDSIQKEKTQNLDDVARLSKDAESIATRLAGVTVGGGVTFLATISSGAYFPYVLIGAGASYFAFDVMLKLLKWWRAPRILEKTQEEKDRFLQWKFEPKYKQQLDQLLDKVHQIAPRSLKAGPVTMNGLGPGMGIEGKSGAGRVPDNMTDLVNASATVQSNVFFTGPALSTAECVSVARMWVKNQLMPLRLSKWLDKLDETNRALHVRGVVYDESILKHEYDVTVSKDDGRILEESKVK